MQCPTLSQLPAPPRDKNGWPWTEESPQLPDTMFDGSPWPRISVVTPSYNQGQYIEETIRSVLLQGYPNLEYVVIDGGSTDDSAEIIRKYEPWLTYWVSEPDRGQSHAINKGWERTTGEMIAWINSDDLYLPAIFGAAACAFHRSSGRMVAAPVINFEDGYEVTSPERLIAQQDLSFEALVKFWEKRYIYQQPGLFFPREDYLEAGPLDETLRYVMDYEFLCRILRRVQVVYLEEPGARFRLHPASKTRSGDPEFFLEQVRVSKQNWPLLADVDPQAFRSFATDYLVRWAGTNALEGRYSDAASHIRASFAISKRETLKSLVAQFFAGLSRHIGGKA